VRELGPSTSTTRPRLFLIYHTDLFSAVRCPEPLHRPGVATCLLPVRRRAGAGGGGAALWRPFSSKARGQAPGPPTEFWVGSTYMSTREGAQAECGTLCPVGIKRELGPGRARWVRLPVADRARLPGADGVRLPGQGWIRLPEAEGARLPGQGWVRLPEARRARLPEAERARLPGQGWARLPGQGGPAFRVRAGSAFK
jgi:hypothetical protein